MRVLGALFHDQEAGLTAESALMLLLVSIAAFAAYEAFGRLIAGFAGEAAAAVENQQ